MRNNSFARFADYPAKCDLYLMQQTRSWIKNSGIDRIEEQLCLGRRIEICPVEGLAKEISEKRGGRRTTL